MVESPYAAAVEEIVARFGPALKVATPLGLGKPNGLLNALYRRVREDSRLSLTLYTALSLSPPETSDPLGGRFLGPFATRQWGDDYENLEYARDARRDRLPANVRVHEFYLQAGSALGSTMLQRDYQAINYTHVVARLADVKPTLVLQLVAEREGRFSLSSNPDLTLDLVDLFRKRGLPLSIVAVVHPDLPFLKGDAEVPRSLFDRVIEMPKPAPRLFGLPKGAVDAVDYAIGFHASRWVVDDGTLQIGIGSLADALVAALLCRQQKNAAYGRLLEEKSPPQPFVSGLHGMSEMIMDGFMHLRRGGILKRKTPDGAYLRGAFFLGSTELYQWLRTLEGDDFDGLRMGRISDVNHLYDLEPHSRRGERKNSRFFNTCMQMTLLGAAASETLEDGRVVSGVGGQYNFVAMAHELPDARSILMLRSTRCARGKRTSNIVWSHGQLTIPRHLRDVVITEYGAADVRGKTDEETILAIAAIADLEFQLVLLDEAKRRGKVAKEAALPPWSRDNTPKRIAEWHARALREGEGARYPFGSDFTPEEERLADALDRLKMLPKPAHWIAKSLGVDVSRFARELERMGLARPRGYRERLLRRALLGALVG